MTSQALVLGIVGPCAAGKSTLIAQLRLLGYQAKHIAQEHSYVQDMWAQIARPDYLIYLDVSFEVSKLRTGSDWYWQIYDNQIQRLAHAREHADLYIQTDDKTPNEVLQLVLAELEKA